MNKKQLPVGLRILLGFLSFILCIALFACSVVTILVADLAVLTSKDGIKDLIKDVLFSTSAPARPGFAPMGVLPGRNPIRMEEPDFSGIDFGSIDLSGFVSGEGGSDAIVDAIYGILEEQVEGELPVSKEDVSNFVENSTLPEFISDKVAGIVTDVISGEVTTTITKEDVMGLLEDNKDLIEDTFEVELPQEVIESVGTMVEESKITETIQQSVSQIVGVTPPVSDSKPEGEGTPGTNNTIGGTSKPIIRPSDMEVLDNVVSGNLSVTDMEFAEIQAMLRIVTSSYVILGCIAACLLLSALLFLTNWGRPNAALRCSGVVYFIAGLLFLIPTAVAEFVPSLFAPLGIAGAAIRKVLSLAGIVSISVTALGLVLIIAGAIVGSALKKKRLAAAAACAEAVCAAEDVDSLSDTLLASEEPAAEEPAEEAEEEAPEAAEETEV